MTQEAIADLAKRLEQHFAQNGHDNLTVVVVDRQGLCKKCGPGSAFEYRQSGSHLGRYCKKCGAWLKWEPWDKEHSHV